MKKLTIVYLVVAFVLCVLIALFIQLNIYTDFYFVLIPFLVFLLVYGVVVMLVTMKKEREYAALNQRYMNDTQKMNDWKMLAKDAHHYEIDELKEEIETLHKTHSQQIEEMQTTNQQILAEMESLHNQEIQSLETIHEKEKEQIIEEKRQAILTLISQREEILPYKFLVDGCESSYGANKHGLMERLKDAESVLSAASETMTGITYERYVGYKLKTMGWTNIEYTRITGDYGIDVLGTDKDGLKACVQCKRYDSNNSIGVKAVQEAYSGRAVYDCEKTYLCVNHDVTAEARHLAQKIGVDILIIN